MNEFLILVALMSCQQAPTDPSRSVADGGPGVAVQDANWEGVLEVDLEAFESTEELRADRRTFATGNLNLDQVFLDRNVGYSQGGLTRSMRYDWVDQGPNSVSVGRGILLPHEVEELWAEVVVRFSRNYTPCNPAKPPCAHKLVFFQVVPDGNERWDVVVGGAGEGGPQVHWTISGPHGRLQNYDTRQSWLIAHMARILPPGAVELEVANDYFDEEWHVLRLHAKHSSSPDAFDGRMRLWLDYNLLYDSKQLTDQFGAPGFATKAGARIRAILIGRNKDKGLDKGTESVWIGRVRAWKEDPGW
jgi:hypothetical protein